ncbi:MAG: dihydrolipoyllysine-residue succinyltransferase [Cocleimonas sp.]|nr:dihydrolipoyllysine-residue succinyltransferase [Cocleimonas sp.]
MSKKIRVPLLPESVSDATIAIWIKKVGENVEEEEVLLELETDKIILEVTASASGVLVEIIEDQDAIVHSGDVIGIIKTEQEIQNLDPVNTVLEEENKPKSNHHNTDVDNQSYELQSQESEESIPNEGKIAENTHQDQEASMNNMPDEQIVDPAQDQSESEIRQEILQELEQIHVPEDLLSELPIIEAQQERDAPENNEMSDIVSETRPEIPEDDSPFASPSVRKAMAEYQLQSGDIDGSGKHGKILKEDVEEHLQRAESDIEERSAENANKDEALPVAESLAAAVGVASFSDSDVAILAGEQENVEGIASPVDSNLDPIEKAHEEEQIEIKTISETPPEPSAEEKPADAETEPETKNNDNEIKSNKTEAIHHRDKNSEDEKIAIDLPLATSQNNEVKSVGNPSERRVPMTRLRARIAERLVEAQQNAAILTTFNDVDLSEIIRLRKIYRDRFEQVHSIKLGFMSFFVKAATEALKRYPEVNARIDGQDVVYQGNYDIGVAVSTERGLVVPIVRDTNTLGHADIEKKINDYAHRARNNQLELNELIGGTFSITNGGVFGSMLSTPIINPPQSAILGMHKIEDRPVAIKGEVVIRPMMYLALSYDHRLIDGKTAVSFLVKIKELLEDPASLFLEL